MNYKFTFQQVDAETRKLFCGINVIKLLFLGTQERRKYYQEMNLSSDDTFIVSATINLWISDVLLLKNEWSISLSDIKNQLEKLYDLYREMPHYLMLTPSFSKKCEN